MSAEFRGPSCLCRIEREAEGAFISTICRCATNHRRLPSQKIIENRTPCRRTRLRNHRAEPMASRACDRRDVVVATEVSLPAFLRGHRGGTLGKEAAGGKTCPARLNEIDIPRCPPKPVRGPPNLVRSPPRSVGSLFRSFRQLKRQKNHAYRFQASSSNC